MTLVQVRLTRDAFQTPWGFRLQGGKDLNQELIVQRVFRNTPSDGELHRGDVIVAINGRDISNFTHKQAQDAIGGGGGQIELLVQRPPAHQVNIKPLTPVTETRAPTLPYSPTKAPQVIIPIQCRKSDVQSPSRTIPISPAWNEYQSDTFNTAGFMPTKITLNKYGGGGMDFGSAYRPAAVHTSQSPQLAPNAQGYRPSAAQAPVLNDDYNHPLSQPNINSQIQFSASQQVISPKHASQKTQNSIPKLGHTATSKNYTTFGVDYSKPIPTSQPSKHSSTTRELSPPVNRYIDEPDSATPWSNTLHGESKQLKPWERDAMEMERYQTSIVDEPYRHYSHSPVAPKQKIVHTTTTSGSRVLDQYSPSSVSIRGGQKKPLVPGERDWNDSYVYQMIHSTETTTTSSHQDASGQPSKGETVTRSREVHETQYPGQAPQRRVNETFTHAGVPDYKFDSAIGLSDF